VQEGIKEQRLAWLEVGGASRSATNRQRQVPSSEAADSGRFWLLNDYLRHAKMKSNKDERLGGGVRQSQTARRAADDFVLRFLAQVGE
jgi:hypothetical protein